MAIGDTPLTVVGNVVNDVELRWTPSGAAVASFRIASTPRKFNKNTGAYEDEQALFLTCNAWRQLAENLAESLSKGMRVIVQGNLKQRSYQNKQGENRTSYEIEVQSAGPDLAFATAQITRNPRQDGPPGRSYGPRTTQQTPGQGNTPPGAPGSAGGTSGGHEGHTWGDPAPTGQQGMPQDEPPF